MSASPEPLDRTRPVCRNGGGAAAHESDLSPFSADELSELLAALRDVLSKAQAQRLAALLRDSRGCPANLHPLHERRGEPRPGRGGRKRVRSNLPQRPEGCCAQIGPDPFFGPKDELFHRTAAPAVSAPLPRAAISNQHFQLFGSAAARTAGAIAVGAGVLAAWTWQLPYGSPTVANDARGSPGRQQVAVITGRSIAAGRTRARPSSRARAVRPAAGLCWRLASCKSGTTAAWRSFSRDRRSTRPTRPTAASSRWAGSPPAWKSGRKPIAGSATAPGAARSPPGIHHPHAQRDPGEPGHDARPRGPGLRGIRRGRRFARRDAGTRLSRTGDGAAGR